MKILNFFDFILENFSSIQVPFQYTGKFSDILSKIDSPISAEFKNLRGNSCDLSLVNVGDSDDTVSFTTSYKLSQHFSTDSERELSILIRPLTHETEIYHKNRTSIKIGRLIRKLFGLKFNDSQIEEFVNKYKSISEERKLSFDIWSGYEILKGYQSKNYTYDAPSTNPLMNSCMNDELHLVDFYQYVPVRLLVLLNDQGHIFGRALIWDTDQGQFMDRVYTAFDSDYYKFVDWAKKNNTIYKSENKSGENIKYIKSGQTSWFSMSVNLKFDIEQYNKDEYEQLSKDIPYMDTFIFGQKNRLSNSEPETGDFFILQETDGYPLLIEELFDIKGVRIPFNKRGDYEWSETHDGWCHRIECQWVRLIQDYVLTEYLKDPKNGFTYKQGVGWIKNNN